MDRSGAPGCQSMDRVVAPLRARVRGAASTAGSRGYRIHPVKETDMTMKQVGAFTRVLLVALTGSAACSDARIDHVTAPRAPALGMDAGGSANRIPFDGVAFECESTEGEITLN